MYNTITGAIQALEGYTGRNPYLVQNKGFKSS